MAATVLLMIGIAFGLAATVLWGWMKVILSNKGYRVFSYFYLSPFMELWCFPEVMRKEDDTRLKKRYSSIYLAWWICAMAFFAFFAAGRYLGRG